VERTVFALFDDVFAVQRVAVALERNGFARSSMSTLAPDPRGRHTRSGPNGAQGVFSPVSIPGLGPAAVTGPLREALAEQGAGLVESLVEVGFSEPDARHYLESLRRGQALFAVESPRDRVDDAVEVMRKLGARAVDETGIDSGAESEPGVEVQAEAARSAPAIQDRAEEAPRPAPAVPDRVEETAPVTSPVEDRVEEAARPTPAAPAVPLAPEPEPLLDRVTVPVVEEQLEVGKRQVNRGGVRIHSHIVEEPIQESVSLREERITVERRPVYRDATEADLADFKEGSIEIHETIEEPVISKRRRVVEEIVIGRETRERTATISETVRRTQVDVEPLPTDGE
jgi:uncharacterized protein (TIGR02271 family)